MKSKAHTDALVLSAILLEAVHALLRNLLLSVINRGDNVPT